MKREILESMRLGALIASLGVAMLFAAGAAFAAAGSGAATINPSSDVVAGGLGTWTIRYTAAEAFSSGTVALVIPNGWSAPQISASSSAGYVTVSSEGTLGGIPLAIGARTITVAVDTLDAGQTIDIVYGDATVDLGGRAAAQTGARSGVEFVVRSDPDGSGDSPIASSPLLDIVAGSPFKLVVSPADTTIIAGDYARYFLGVEDSEGNASPLSNDQEITLLGQPGAFYSTSNHATPIAAIVIPNGSDHVLLDYRNVDKEMDIPLVLAFLDVNGSAPTLEAASAQIYIDNAPLNVAASEISVNKASAVANAIDSIEITVRARDIFYNGVDGATVLIASTGSNNLLHQPSGVTSGTGSAIGSIASTKAEGKSLTAKINGIDISASSGVTFIPGPFDPAASDVSVDKTSAVANGMDSIAVTALVTDARGNPIAGSFVEIEATGTLNTISPSSGVTGVDGRLVGKMRSTKAELKMIDARVGGVLIAQTRNVTFNAGPFSASASNVTVDKTSAVANGIDSVTVTVLVTDAYNNAISGGAVTVEATGGPNTIVPPSGLSGLDGRMVAKVKSTKAELKVIDARVGGVLITQTRGVTFSAGPFSAAMSDVQVDKTSAMANGADSVTVTALVTDLYGNAISGSAVTVEATGGPNTIVPPSGLSGLDGRMVAKVRSTKAELKTVRARVGATLITQTRDVTFTAGAFSASASTVTVDKTTVVADGADAVTVTVTVKDAQNNPIAGNSVTIESTGTLNNITQPIGLTGVDGVASGTVKSTKAEGKDITAKVGGVEVSTKPHVTFTNGPFDPDASDVQVDKTTALADGIDVITVTVYARDAQGNGISGKTVAIAATGGGNIIGQPAVLTDGNGRAIGSLKSTIAEGKTISAKVNGADITEYVPVTFGAGALHHFYVTHGGSATAGVASLVTIDARDAQNNRITNFTGIAKVYTSSTVPGDFIAWGLGNAAGSILSEVGDTVRYQFVPADGGDAELSITDNKVESITIYASSGAVTSSSATPLVVNRAAADRVILVSGNNQRAVVNQEVAASLVVRVEDAFGNAVPGVTVSWSITSGGGYFDASRTLVGQQTTSVTASDGTTAGELWRLGTVSGLNSDAISASMPSGSIRTVSFIATTDHGTINSIVLTPTSKAVTVSSPTIVTATMRDVFNNLIPGEFVTIFIKDTPDGTLSAAAGSPTDPLGPYARRGMSDSTGTVSVTYNAPAAAGLQDIIDAYSNTIPAGSVADVTYTTVANGATDLSATVLAGQTSQAGVTFSFRVEAVDGNGNRDLTNASRIVLDPAVAGGFTFSLTNFGAPITEANLASGAVTLYGRGSKQGSWPIQVRDKAAALSPDQFDITIVPNDTVSSYVVSSPANVTAGVDFSVSAEARDRFSNRVTTAGYAINFRAVQAADSSHAASGTLSVSNGSLVNGLFTGNGFRYTVAEPIRVEVTSAANPVKGYSGVTTVGNALAYQLVKLSGDSAGVQVGDSLRVRARVLDIYGNAVSGQTVFFTVQQGNGHLQAPQAVTGATGAVSLWFRTDTIRGVNQVRASILDANPEGLETQSFTVSTVPKSAIARVTLSLPGVSFQAGESFTGNVAAYDRYGNLIDTDSSSQLRCVARRVTMAFVPGVMTLAAGRSSFSASDPSAGFNRIRVLSLAGDSLSDWSDLITIRPGPAYRIVEVRGDTLGVPVGSKAGLKARVSDVYGNAVPSEIVRFVITSNLGGSPSLWDGTGAPGDGLVLTDAMGAAVCSLTTDSHAGTNTVSASILDANPPALERVLFTVGTAAGTISRFDVIPDGFAKKAGEIFSLSITAYDVNGNVANSDDTSHVTLGSNGSAAFSINPVILSHGRATVSVHDNKAESLVLNARTLAGGALSYSGAIAVSPEVPAGAITFASIVPDSITANGTSLSAITTQPVRDTYGNVVATGTLVRVTPSLGTVASDDQDPSTPLTYERQTAANGAVSVFIRSASAPGLATVAFQSVTGSAAGNATIPFMPAPSCAYAGYLTPRYLVPTHAASFRCSIVNGSATGLYLNTQSRISFADSSSNTFEAHLAAPAFVRGSSTDTLDFESTVVPAGMLGGAYTPRVRLVGADIYASPYQTEFNAGSNSVSVSDIEIMRVTAPSIVSRGETFVVVVRIRNGGGSVVSVNDIVPRYGHGYFGVTGASNPPLPDNLPAGAERDYRRSMYVFMNSPLGADTIDASVTASAGGSQVQDGSAYPNVAPIVVQSAASIAYVPGSLSPAVVSKGQSHGFSVSLRNDGQAAVILSGSGTSISFTDGTDTLRVALGAEGALPGGRVTNVVFPSATVPLAMDAGSWPVSLRLRGTENGATFGQTLVLSDAIAVVDPAQLAYRPGSVAPTPVSKRSAVAFEFGINNTGGATVVCNPDSTWIKFSSGSIVYTARLDGSRGADVAPGARTLYFNAVTIPDAMPTGKYRPTVRVKGTENGLPFSAILAASDSIAVQSPSQLAITSTTVFPSDSITADQAKKWFASIRVDNNGGAAVRLDSLAVRLYAGSQEVTSECGITALNFHPRVDVLNGGQGTNIIVQLEDGSGPMTTGTIVIESTLRGRDMNSGAVLVATTEFGGKGSYLVQTPAAVAVVAVLASADTVTASQRRDWTVDVVLRNTGQSAVALNLSQSNTFLTFSTSGDFLVVGPLGLAGGGVVLEGGSTDTLRYLVDRTGSVPGLCRIASTVRATEINSERTIVVSSGASGIYGDVLVQSEAALEIVGFTPLQDPVTIAQARDWTIEMEVRNTGESDATLLLDRTDSTWVAVPEGSGFAIENPAELPGGGRTLRGGSTAILPFVVRTTGSIAPGRRVISGAVLASENNSGRTLHAERYAPSSVDSVSFELRPDPRYVAGSLTPTRVSSGASVAFDVRISSDASRRSALVLDYDKVIFSFGDADGDTFRTSLSPVSEHILVRGGEIHLLFRDVPVDTAIAHVTLPVSLHLEGTENGNPFSADFAVLSDSVSIEQAPQLSINRIVVPQSVTRSQVAPWPARMVLKNNGEASVVIDFNSAKTFINFNIVGLGDRTYEYGIDYPDRLEGSRTDTLAGGAVDSLVFIITPTGSTGGLALVNGKVTATDINSGLTIFDDTFDGGSSHMAIQNPGAPAIARTTPERSTVTSGQTTPWLITIEACNGGEADLTLVMDSTYVFYGNRIPLSQIAPAEFAEGGGVLEGGSCKHLVFTVSPTPAIPAGANIALHAHVGFMESNSAEYRVFDTKQAGSGSGTVRVQAPARIRIAQVENEAPRSPYVNINQRFPISFKVINEGEATAESIRVALEKSGSSAIDDTLLVMDALGGAASASDTFKVTAGTSTGLETFRARIRGAVDGNSGESGLVHVDPALDDTTRAIIQSLAALEVSSVRPSQREVNASQAADWTVCVSLVNRGTAPLALDAPAAGDLAFSLGGTRRFDYLVIAPDTLGSGSGVLSLAGGASDSLIYRISSTGSDTGMVAINAGVGWTDMNDPLREHGTANGSGSVHVKAPSGLRIVSVTSDAPNNALFPNTSVVDADQAFHVTVRVENTGGDDIDSVDVHLVSNGATRTAIVGDSLLSVASKSEKDFVFSVVAGSAPASEILTSSIVYAVSRNTGERVYPAQAAESIENIRVELPALLACGVSVTAPAGALDDTLSTGQTFVVTAAVANEGQALVDTTGEVTLELPPSMHLANSADPLVKHLGAVGAVSWTLVAPATPSQDTVRARISRVPADVNTAAAAAVRVIESGVALHTEDAARVSGCAFGITAPQGAIDGTLSTEQNFTARMALIPSANADSVWVVLTAPAGFSVVGDRTRFLGAGTGTQQTIDWIMTAPVGRVDADTFVVRSGGKDGNSGRALGTCRVAFPVHVQVKPSLALSARISGPEEALDGSVSVSLPFTIEATAAKTGEAAIDTAGARMELVLPSGQGYTLDGALETYRKPFYPGESVVWNVKAPAAPTSPGNIEVRFVEPYATDVNTNVACEISIGEAFIPVQTQSGSVLMSNISRGDSIPPFVVPQGAQDVPVLRFVLKNASAFTIGLDTLYVAIEDGRGNLVADPVRSVDSVSCVAGGSRFTAAVALVNPLSIVVDHRFTLPAGSVDTLLLAVDIGARAPAGQIAFEIERSAGVVISVSESGARIGVSLELDGGDIAGHFRSGPLSIMSSRFDEYVHNYPNPFRAGTEPTKICYFLKRNMAVTIKIYDLGGSLVWTKSIGAGDAGGTGTPAGIWHEIPWNGRNDRGELVRNGVYVCKVEAGSQSALFKIAVAK